VATKIADATYDEAVLDWAVAELMSPTWRNHEAWAGPEIDLLRAKISSGGVASLEEYERAWLISKIGFFRGPVISAHGPFRSWTFWRASVPRAELSQFSIMSSFPYPSYSFGDLSTKIRDNPTGRGETDMSVYVRAINRAVADGRAPPGCPIAVVPPSAPPMLIEGYKRAMAALWRDEQSLELFFCGPGAEPKEKPRR
jgi:hypothetical protein